MYVNYKFIHEGKFNGWWLMETCPVIYAAKTSLKEFRICISIMNLYSDLPLTVHWEHASPQEYIRRAGFPGRCDYVSLFRFYKKETAFRMRVFPFAVRVESFLILQFDCLVQHGYRNGKYSPQVYVFFRFPPLCALPDGFYLSSEVSVYLALPHILDFLSGVTDCKKVIFLIERGKENYLNRFRLLGRPVIIPPRAGKPYWSVCYS